MTNLLRLPPSTTFTAEQALKSALDDNLEDVMILGYDKDGDLYIRSSRITCAEAMFMCMKGLRWAETGGQP
jgi:hypothetical protein